MKTPSVLILGVAVVLAGGSFTCSRVRPGPVPAAAPSPAAEDIPGPGAYDVVKMGRLGTRMGPIYFAHALHADLPSLDGEIIACSACHFEVCGPPRRCGECHLSGRRRSEAKLPST